MYSTFYQSFGGVVPVLFAIFALNLIHFWEYSIVDWTLLGAGAILESVAILCNSLAYKYAEVGKVVPIIYSSMLYPIAFDLIVLHYSMSFMEIVGVMIVIISVITPSFITLIKS